MKKILICIFMLVIFLNLGYSQEKPTLPMSFKIGWLAHSNTYNIDNYNKIRNGIDNNIDYIYGLSFETIFPTKYQNLNYLLGSIYLGGDLKSKSWSAGNYGNEASIYCAGVFGGINPKLGTKNFGFDFSFGLGFFSVKSTQILFNNEIDINSTNISNNIGLYNSAGIYFRFWRITITPSYSIIVTGDKDNRFFSNGVQLPLTFNFTNY